MTRVQWQGKKVRLNNVFPEHYGKNSEYGQGGFSSFKRKSLPMNIKFFTKCSSHIFMVVLSVWFCHSPEQVKAQEILWNQEQVMFLGTTLNQSHRPQGVVETVMVAFRNMKHQRAMNVSFASGPGKFSPYTQVAIKEGIKAVAFQAGHDTKTWDVLLTFPHSRVTIFGDSISAMIGLTVLALANHMTILPNRVLTGRITDTGTIGAVGGIPLKIQAAFAKRIQRVIIPDESFPADSDWRIPFLLHVSPVSDVMKAYTILTGQVFPRRDPGPPPTVSSQSRNNPV